MRGACARRGRPGSVCTLGRCGCARHCVFARADTCGCGAACGARAHTHARVLVGRAAVRARARFTCGLGGKRKLLRAGATHMSVVPNGTMYRTNHGIVFISPPMMVRGRPPAPADPKGRSCSKGAIQSIPIQTVLEHLPRAGACAPSSPICAICVSSTSTIDIFSPNGPTDGK